MTVRNEYRTFQLGCLMVVGVLLLASPGCSVCTELEGHVETVTAGHDGYDRLIRSTFDGTIDPRHGLPVTGEELSKSTNAIRMLIDNLITSVYLSRKAWHTARFMLGNGPDPKSMDLAPPDFPEPEDEDEDASLLEEND